MTPGDTPFVWTLEAVKIHLEMVIANNQERTEDRLKALREMIDERDKRWPTHDDLRKEFKILEADIESLRETRSEGHGERTGLHEKRTDLREDRRVWFAGGAFIVSLIALYMQLFL